MNNTWVLRSHIFDRLAALAEKDYPEETCGLLFGTDDALEIVPMENIQNRLHELDPDNHPRDAKTAYQFDALEFEKVRQEKEVVRGLPLRSIYHSHPDHDAYFSKKDRSDAAPEGWGPLFPEVIYIVFSVLEGRLRETKGYRWSEESEDFVETFIARGQ